MKIARDANFTYQDLQGGNIAQNHLRMQNDGSECVFRTLITPEINYLGFAGTMGAKFIDYIIADQYLIPPDNSKYFTEKQIYLPNTFMPTDNSRELLLRKTLLS